ncbi:uncharacterized protein CDAR_127231 [Caerostris darwini]|uniref:Uncharacterized protein n=1 Tax=Caerostris darwini TaxID=1538125 RepID=A0AAV4X8L2_9ARAC|nr:uncharacterized protein CDAR_127231 [Caerostris darwini]
MDENSQHSYSYCPVRPESWCKWRKSEAEGTLETFEHPPALDDEAQEILKPIYEDLLESCLGKKIVDVPTYYAACTFNEGFTAILKIMDVMGIKIGPQAEQLARKRDARRVYTIQPIVGAPVTPKRPEQLGRKLNPNMSNP